MNASSRRNLRNLVARVRSALVRTGRSNSAMIHTMRYPERWLFECIGLAPKLACLGGEHWDARQRKCERFALAGKYLCEGHGEPAERIRQDRHAIVGVEIGVEHLR